MYIYMYTRVHWKNKTPNKHAGVRKVLRKMRGSHFENVSCKTKSSIVIHVFA